MWVELHEHLPQHFAAQSFAHLSHLVRSMRGAFLAVQSDFYTNIWVRFFVCRHIEVLVCRTKVFLQTGLKRVLGTPFAGIPREIPCGAGWYHSC